MTRYIDFRNEVETKKILEKAWELGKKVAEEFQNLTKKCFSNQISTNFSKKIDKEWHNGYTEPKEARRESKNGQE